jgi:hypothetical protein
MVAVEFLITVPDVPDHRTIVSAVELAGPVIVPFAAVILVSPPSLVEKNKSVTPLISYKDILYQHLQVILAHNY